MKCITRKNKKWYSPTGKRLSKKQEERVRKIGIPPAYTDVCVNPNAEKKLQGTAYDKKAQRHYYYHAKYVETNQKKRLRRVKAMNGKKILNATAKIIDKNKKDREWKAAVALRLIAITGIRSGNQKYLRENGSVGAMTLYPKHVVLGGGGVSLKFKGKSKVEHNMNVKDVRLRKALRWLKKYESDTLFGVNREEVVDILRRYGKDLQLKDLRTMLAMNLYKGYYKNLKKKYKEEKEKTLIKNAIKLTAKQLGHTPSVCKKYYLLDLKFQ